MLPGLTRGLLVLMMLSHMRSAVADDPDPMSGHPEFSIALQRVPPKSPEEALGTFRLLPGFRIELVAAEPLIRSPIAIDFDEEGRMYVVEYAEYNQYAKPGSKLHGSVKLLEDRDRDGRYETSHDFINQINTPMAVACYDGGVFIGAVPDILYCKDTDGDGRADVRQVVYTGFGGDPAGEGMLNSFRWGIDNKFHVSTGPDGGDVHRANAQIPSYSVRSQNLIFDPRSHSLELTSGGGQHGMSFDDWGRCFVCANSNPTEMLMYDGRYVSRNPHLKAPAAVVDITPGGKFTKLFRISENEPWRVLRTRMRKQGLFAGSDEGGEPSGFFTGATGVTVYRGDAWPQEYYGNIFVGEVANNLVYRARLEPNGVGMKAVRADEGHEFLASTDIWFRPVQFAHGPDGNLYVIDMYRELIEGAAFLPPEILSQLDVTGGFDRGRVYRICRDDISRRTVPQLSTSTSAELVDLLEHPNSWHRETASRLLYQRQDRAAVGPLRKLATDSTSGIGRTQAIYALDGLGALESGLVLDQLKDRVPEVRELALIMAENFVGDPLIRSQLISMVDDPAPRVRYQLAFSLGAFPGETPTATLVKLATADGENPWMQLAILSSAGQCSGSLFAQLLANGPFLARPHGRAFLGALIDQIGSAQRTSDLAAVLSALEQLPESESETLQQFVQRLANAQPREKAGRVTESSRGRIESVLKSLLNDARRIATDPQADSSKRIEAVRTLALGDFADHRELFENLLTSKTPQPIQLAVLQTLARFDASEIPSLILAAWPTLSPQLRATAIETLLARGTWVNSMLDAVAQGQLKASDLDPARIALLQSSRNPAIQARAKGLFAGTQLSLRQSVVDNYRQALDLKGDPAQGKVVFKKACAICHRLEEIGEAVGADLKGIGNRGLDSVLLNILDPNREVKPQYLNYVLELQDGRIITGMITAESANSIALRRADGTSEPVLRVDIENLQSTGLSYMPEGLEKQLDCQEVADLLAYLNSIK